MAFVLVAPAHALEFFADEDHKGILKLEDGLSIFPENRASNALYLKGELIQAEDGKTILDAVKVPSGFVYSVSNAEGVNYLVPRVPNDYAVSRFEVDGLLLQEKSSSPLELYYVIKGGKIMNLQLSYRSSGGFSVNPRGDVAYFYIKKFTGNPPNRIFTMTVSVYRIGNNTLQTMEETIDNTEAKLDLKWLNENTLGYSTTAAKNLKISLK